MVELKVPKDWGRFRLPKALDDRLRDLLDRQDREGRLSPSERKEAQALVDLADMLSLMKLRARRGSQRKSR